MVIYQLYVAEWFEQHVELRDARQSRDEHHEKIKIMARIASISKMKGNCKDLKVHRNDRVIPLSLMKQKVVVCEVEAVIQPEQLFHRIV